MKTVVLLSGKKSTGKDTSFEFIRDAFECEDCEGTYVAGGGFPSFDGTKATCFTCYDGRVKSIKKMSFADPLKSLCRNAFGLSEKQCYGESGERETPSDIKWSDIAISYHSLRKSKEEFLSAREILQFVGTNVMRNFFPNIWAKAATISALDSPADIVVFTDARFPNEIEEFEKLEAEGKIKLLVVRLRRDTNLQDGHASEVALDSWDDDGRFANVIFNNGTLSELKAMLSHLLVEKGLLNAKED